MFRNHVNRFKLRSRTRFALCISALLCFLSACYDDTFNSFQSDKRNSPYISFKIIGDTTSVGTRSGDAIDEYIRNVYLLTSEADSNKLYLIESETDGINIDRTSSPAGSRGGMINKSEEIQLGLYGFKSPEDGDVPSTGTELDLDHWTLRTGESSNGVSYPSLYDNEGTLRNDKKWPGYPLDFVAYYPYTAAFQHVDTEMDYTEELYSWIWSPRRNGLCMHPVPRNGMYLYYRVPDSIKHQEDLMADYIQRQDRSTSPCELTMKHLLTAVRFETGDDMPPCTIKKIILSGVRYSGYMSVMRLTEDNKTKLWWEKPEI